MNTLEESIIGIPYFLSGIVFAIIIFLIKKKWEKEHIMQKVNNKPYIKK